MDCVCETRCSPCLVILSFVVLRVEFSLYSWPHNSHWFRKLMIKMLGFSFCFSVFVELSVSTIIQYVTLG